MEGSVYIRDVLQPTDLVEVRRLAEAAGNFSPTEISVAGELIDEAWNRGPSAGYFFLFAERQGHSIGFACYGPIPLTQASFDLYWIVVDRCWQGKGVGRRLLEEVEARVRKLGGRQLYIETSGREQYCATRHFYQRRGYQVVAELPDFYAVGDAKVIYCKRLC